MGSFFSKSKQDICPVTVKAFYIVGTAEERIAKCSELIAANPKLGCRIIEANENYSVTALQLSNKSFPVDFEDIKARAEAQQAEGDNSVFMLSAPVREFRM